MFISSSSVASRRSGAAVCAPAGAAARADRTSVSKRTDRDMLRKGQDGCHENTRETARYCVFGASRKLRDLRTTDTIAAAASMAFRTFAHVQLRAGGTR